MSLLDKLLAAEESKCEAGPQSAVRLVFVSLQCKELSVRYCSYRVSLLCGPSPLGQAGFETCCVVEAVLLEYGRGACGDKT
jgi:hypothetical protein